jgi:excisionase family DNA binding protein
MGAAAVIVMSPEQLDEAIERAISRALASRPALVPVAPTPAGYLKVTVAAERYSVAPETLREWIRAGKLPRHRAGRHWLVRPDEVEALIARGGTTAPAEVDPAEVAARVFRRVNARR